MKPPEQATGHGSTRADVEYKQRKFELRVGDLRRYSIQTILVDEYDEIPDILEELERRVRTRSVFVSGSAVEYGHFGKDRMEDLLRKLGRALVRSQLRVVSGLGLGVGGEVVLGAMEELYRAGVDGLGNTEDLLAIRPFPIGIEDVEERARIWAGHRQSMLKEAGVAVFVAGNRLEDGEIVDAPGVLEEFRIAIEEDVIPIPVGVTGYAARILWDRVSENLELYFRGRDVSRELRILGQPASDNATIVETILSIIERFD